MNFRPRSGVGSLLRSSSRATRRRSRALAAAAGTPGSLSAAVRSGAGAFAATETVTEEPVSDAPIQAAFDPASARPMVVYRPQLGPTPSALALATRSVP